jgi:NADH dehydrogenase FAD-containing subunit
VVVDNSLANASGGRWAGVKPSTFESTAAAGVYVIGDSCSAGIPKAGHIGNQEGKTAADAIIRSLRGLAPDTDVVVNSACFSPITSATASWLTAVYRYDASVNGYKIVGTAPAEATNPTSENYEQMNIWFNTLMGETFA